MKTKTYSYRGRIYSEIPQEVVEALKIKAGDEIEFKPVYDNVVLLTPSKEAKEESKSELSKEKIELLKKVNSIKHYDRTYDKIVKGLNTKEKEIFDELLKNDVLFKYKRSGKELIGIDKNYFKYIIEQKDDLIEKLVKDGCIVIEEQSKIKALTDRIKSEKLNVRGIRGFDKRYYIMSQEKLSEIEDKLEKILTKEKMLKTISAELGLPEDLCKAAIEILREDGKIVERKKNTYVLA
jgi:bifunctional DNA-binding transcriptional regulator/antitoxin component of YhaV-PrlF toxin-antitoxin module